MKNKWISIFLFFAVLLLTPHSASARVNCMDVVCNNVCENGYSVTSGGCPSCQCLALNAITPTPFIDINVVNPQGAPVAVPYLSFSYYCGFYNQCFSVFATNTSSAQIYGYGRARGGGGITLGSNQIYLGVTPVPGGGTANTTNNNFCRTWYCEQYNTVDWYNYWWPIFPSMGFRSLTFVVATPTPVPPTATPIPSCNTDANCTAPAVCYQPPMPPCRAGMSCIQAFPPRICATPTPPVAVSVSVSAPTAGSVLSRGSATTVSWTQSGTSASTSLHIYKRVGTTDTNVGAVTYGATHSSGANTYSWTVPPAGGTSATTLDGETTVIEVIARNSSGVSIGSGKSSTFTISTPVGDPCSQGDVNCNGTVDLADFIAYKLAFNGQNLPAPQSADLNVTKDGKVDLLDFEIWRSNYYK